ncbi:gastrula zinc finger protein XlCGF67.1-like [Malaya genurostris]|uniref:gastrula zinc finger protein XlCGF67.1-like n=1 Tax=Malaya genurostris TaxID=325434 RepID=UPI0026F38922|nr:gastrula zinc finger protein XlCGF67.1-like [Malaya genurostris]
MTTSMINLDARDSIITDNATGSEEDQSFDSQLDKKMHTSPEVVYFGDLFDTATTEPTPIEPGKELFVCEVCSKHFEDQKKLIRHRKIHSHRRLKCEYCGVYLKSKSSYSSHIQRHKNGRQFECDMCGKCFSDRRDLRAHTMVHDPQAERFRCFTCGKDFGRIYYLWDHQKLHSGEANFSCPNCKKIFSNRRSLLLHERSHLLEEDMFK